jgi:hypothetical protein
VTDGARTRDNRSHNPVLYQLSYGHHDNEIVSGERTCSGTAFKGGLFEAARGFARQVAPCVEFSGSLTIYRAAASDAGLLEEKGVKRVRTGRHTCSVPLELRRAGCESFDQSNECLAGESSTIDHMRQV